MGLPGGSFWSILGLLAPPPAAPGAPAARKSPQTAKNTKSIVKNVVLFKKSAFSLGFYEAPGVDFSRFSSPRKLKKHVFYEGFKVFAVYRAGPEKGPK